MESDLRDKSKEKGMPNYYPNETTKKWTHVIEHLQKPNCLYSVCGEKDITEDGLAATVWSSRSWEVIRVSMKFSDATEKDYAISTVRGAGIVSGVNDRLWLKMDGAPAKQVIVPQGFYTGTGLASAVETGLNASDLPASGKPFLVDYDATTNLFSITPDAGNVKLLVVNPCVLVRRDSTAAGILGFTANSAMGSPITSDTGVPALGTEITVISGLTTTVQDVVSTDTISMTIDNQLLISTGTANGVMATYEVVYRILDV